MPFVSLLHHVCLNPVWVSISVVSIQCDATVNARWERAMHTDVNSQITWVSLMSSPLRHCIVELCFCLWKHTSACSRRAGLHRAVFPSASALLFLCAWGNVLCWGVPRGPFPGFFPFLSDVDVHHCLFAKPAQSGCGADNECWFIYWLRAILRDLCSGGRFFHIGW